VSQLTVSMGDAGPISPGDRPCRPPHGMELTSQQAGVRSHKMRELSITRLAALGALVAGLACAKTLDTGMAKPNDTAAKPDTGQAPPGYKAGARDTTRADTSMQMPKDTSSMRMPKDTSSMHMPKDTSSMQMPKDSTSR